MKSLFKFELPILDKGYTFICILLYTFLLDYIFKQDPRKIIPGLKDLNV
jgi:hypothetical protein